MDMISNYQKVKLIKAILFVKYFYGFFNAGNQNYFTIFSISQD